MNIWFVSTFCPIFALATDTKRVASKTALKLVATLSIFESIHKQNESVVQGRKIKTSVKYEIHEVIITSAQTGKNENK